MSPDYLPPRHHSLSTLPLSFARRRTTALSRRTLALAGELAGPEASAVAGCPDRLTARHFRASGLGKSLPARTRLLHWLPRSGLFAPQIPLRGGQH